MDTARRLAVAIASGRSGRLLRRGSRTPARARRDKYGLKRCPGRMNRPSGATGVRVEPIVQRRIQRYGWDRAAEDYEPLWGEQIAVAQAAPRNE